MVVYFAAEKDYPKIAKFIASLPKTSLPYQCYQMPGACGRSLQELKHVYPSLRVLVVEDDRGEIRVVSLFFVGKVDYEGREVACNFNLCILMRPDDLASGNLDYVMEIGRFQQREYWRKLGIKFTQLTLVGGYMDFLGGFREFYGDCLEVLLVNDEPFKRCILRIDNEKFTERMGIAS